jgi:hypothetical protein
VGKITKFMPYEDLKIQDWLVDKETGYLRHKVKQDAITPEQKVSFLEALLRLGSEAAAAKFAGFNHRALPVHKRADAQFREDHAATLQEMANTLEGVMYLNAQQPKGTLDRFGWLRAHYPKKWSPKSQQDATIDKKSIDALWEGIQQDKKEKA